MKNSAVLILAECRTPVTYELSKMTLLSVSSRSSVDRACSGGDGDSDVSLSHAGVMLNIAYFTFNYRAQNSPSFFTYYLSIMRRFVVLFICWKQRQYNKSTMSLLSDTIHQKLNNDKYFFMKEQMLTAITEKKVQTWHSLLRDSIEQ